MFGALFDFSLFNFDRGPGHASEIIPEHPPTPVPSGHGNCAVCGADDWDLDEARGDLRCVSCGLCVDFRAVHSTSFAAQAKLVETGGIVEQESLRCVAFGGDQITVRRRPRKRNKYQRKEYLKERFNQWFLQEPEISGDDWLVIEWQFDEWCKQTHGRRFPKPSGRELARGKGIPHKGCLILSKADVRAVLHNCDLVKEEDYPWPLEKPAKNYFKKKYLERWLTIRWRFSGQGSTSRYVASELVELLYGDFDKLEEAHRILAPKFGRKSFPNYNTIIYRVLELYNCEFLAEDFPPLRTRKAARKIEILWWHYCKYLRWPYISDKADILKRYLKTELDDGSAGLTRHSNQQLQRRRRSNTSRRA
jgi:hypothetical protein